MAIKGGYTMVDLGGASFTAGTPKTIAGIFNKIKNSYGKPILLTGIVIGGVPIKDQWLNLESIASGATSAYIGYIAGYGMSVVNTDAVTFTAAQPLVTASLPSTNGTYTLKGTKNSSGFTYDWVKDT